jgi:DNA transposition AAA+ family ATPase
VAEILEINDTKDTKVMPGPDWSKERRILWKLLYEEGAKQEDVACAIGKSRAAVSLYARNVSPEREEFQRKVREYLKSVKYWEEDQEETGLQQVDYITNVEDIGFIETDDYRRVIGVCEMSARHREFGIVIGDPGTGKTRSLERYLESNSEAVLVTCDEMSTKKSVLIDTAEALGTPTWGSAAIIVRRIVRELQKRPRLLLYDEADMLKKTSLLEALRGVYDKARTIGIVLCGNQTLAQRIMEIAEDRPELARIKDRVGIFIKLRGLSAEEAGRFLVRINLTAGARKMLSDVGRKRGIRQLMKALGRLLEVTHGEQIDEDLVGELDQIVLSFKG